MDPELQKLINIRSARGWKPNPGETLVGTVAHIGRRESEYGAYPVVTLAADSPDDPEAVNYIAVNAFHSILKTALYDIKPAIGSRLSVTYQGQIEGKRKDKDGNPVKYHAYTVIDPDAPAEETEFSWDDDPAF